MKRNTNPYTFEVFKGSTIGGPEMAHVSGRSPQHWYWRLRAANGKIVADGSEGYSSKSAAKAAVRRVYRNLTGWGVLTWRAM